MATAGKVELASTAHSLPTNGPAGIPAFHPGMVQSATQPAYGVEMATHHPYGSAPVSALHLGASKTEDLAAAVATDFQAADKAEAEGAKSAVATADWRDRAVRPRPTRGESLIITHLSLHAG